MPSAKDISTSESAQATAKGRARQGESKARAKADAPGSSTQRIVDAVRAAVLERRLLPGTKLTEQQVADIFQVSRSIVRQALHQLERARLVTLEPARGAFVREPDAAEAAEIFAVRTVLEVDMAGRLAEGLSPPQVAALQQHMAAERAAFEQADASLALGLLVDFHRLLAELLGNRVLCEMMGDLLSRSSLIALKMPIPDAAEHAHEEHVQIVQALETGNAALARRLMGEHLAQVQTLLQPATRKPDLLSALRPQASTP